MAGDTAGMVDLFKENFDSAVRGIVLKNTILKKDICTVQGSTAAEEHFYEESVRELGSSTEIPKDAEFFADNVEWTKTTIRPRKFGVETRLSWEDAIVNNVDIAKRTTIRMANRIARDVDARIWTIISESQSPATIRTVAANANWDHVTRSNRIPHEDVASAKRQITDSEVQAYTPNTLLLSPLDAIYVLTNDYVLGSFDASSPAVMSTGRLGTLLGLNVIEHPVVTDDYAMVLESKKCATWKQVSDIKTEIIEDPGISKTLRAWEYGNVALTDPKAVCLITNTQA